MGSPITDPEVLSSLVYVYRHTSGTRGITPDGQPWSFWQLDKHPINHGTETFVGRYTLGTLTWLSCY